MRREIIEKVGGRCWTIQLTPDRLSFNVYLLIESGERAGTWQLLGFLSDVGWEPSVGSIPEIDCAEALLSSALERLRREGWK